MCCTDAGFIEWNTSDFAPSGRPSLSNMRSQSQQYPLHSTSLLRSSTCDSDAHLPESFPFHCPSPRLVHLSCLFDAIAGDARVLPSLTPGTDMERRPIRSDAEHSNKHGHEGDEDQRQQPLERYTETAVSMCPQRYQLTENPDQADEGG